LSNFLNNKASTLGGVKQQVIAKVKEIEQKGNFDFNALKGMSKQEKVYVAQYLATENNRQISALEKEGIQTPATREAAHYNEATGRKKNRFYRGSNFVTTEDLNIHLQEEMRFHNAKTNTLEGFNNMNDSRLEKFRKMGIDIPKGKEQEFFDFLASEQFKKMGANDDSKQIAKTYYKARKAGHDVTEINEAFSDYLNKNLSLDEVQERLHIAEWQDGGLLK
jgi:hypothetical protein